MTPTDYLARVLREGGPDVIDDYVERLKAVQRQGMIGLATVIVSALAILWLAPWWGKLLVPLLWGFFETQTAQIGAGFLTLLVAAQDRGDRSD